MVTGLPPCGPKNQSQDSLTHPFKTVEFPYGKKEEGSEASCSKEETEEKKEQA